MALANGSAWAMASTRSAAAPSTSSDSLPLSRVIIWACASSGKNGRSDLRISPRLSNSRNSIHSGFSNVCSPWTALMRLSVVSESSRRIAWAAGSGSRSRAPSRACPATLWVTSPVGLDTRFWVNSRAVSGLTTPNTPSVWRRSSSTCWRWAMFSGVNRSVTVWPSSIVNRVTMAWPPKRSW